MSSIVNSSLAKIAAIVVAVSLVAGFAFTFSASRAEAATLTEAQIQSIISLLQSFGADSTTIANVSASLRGTTPPSSGGGSTSAACPFNWTRNLTVGSTGSDVLALQKFLNSDSATMVAASGAGSAGAETSYFGPATKAAVVKFQNKYAANVLTPVGLTAGTGFFGPSSRAKANELCAAGGTPTTPPPTTTPGTGISVAAGSQPANALAPQGANRVPFTRFTLTAGSNGPVTVNSVTVQRVGAGNNAAFSGVVLIDQDGNQLGTSKSFNSNDQATIGEAITIPAGQSRTFTVAGNMAASLSSYSGQAPGISVVAVNTSATVSGTLPITGAFHTLNSTLTVGSLSLDTSNAYASNSVGTKEIGTTNYRATGFRLTAGSAEDVRLKMIRFNQTGSVSTMNDLANIKVVINGTAYPTTVSADGKYVTANLGAGILITKGNSIEVYVQYDIVGANASNRTVIFDVDKTTDIYAEGVTYGYGISPGAGATSVPTDRTTANTTETSGTPYIYGAQVTVSGASVTTIQKSNTVPSQNIAVNVPNQVLGGFETDIKGEAITVQSLVFSVATTAGDSAWVGLLTNVSLVDENGSVVAGPVDATGAGTTLTFTDAVTLKTGKHTYTLRGKVPSTASNNATIIVSTNPATGWTNAKGDVTGNSITFSQTSFALNTMTVRAGSVVISRATSPASQTVVAGGTSVLMANFSFDASQSGEDVRFASAPVILRMDAGPNDLEGDPDFLTSCQLFDGSTALNTGSNVLNPSATATTSDETNTITLDNPVTVTKGTVKTLSMRCNVSASTPTNSEFAWDVQDAGNWTFTGATSGTDIAESNGSDNAVVVTISTGAVTVATDPSSPSYKLVSAGSTDVTIGAIKFRASNEPLNLQKLGLSLTNTASSSPGDLIKVSVYDGSTKVGEAFFTGSNTTATSTFSSVVTLPKDTDKTLTIKADLANIGIGQAATTSGHLIAIDYLNAEGVGAESGTTRQLGSAAGSTAVAGVRVMKSFPTVALDTLPAGSGAAGRLMRFKVTADSKGPIGLTELNFIFSTSSATLSNVNVFVYEDASYSQAVSGIGTSGMFSTTNGMGTNWVSATTNFEFTAYNGSASTSLQIPAGGTRYFEVRGSVAPSSSTYSITTTLKGGTAFITCGITGSSRNPLCAATHANLDTANDFVWSPNSTTTSVRADQDWTGGYGVPGLPASGLSQTASNN